MRALADRLGKHSAHDSVYAAAMHGLDQGQDFRAALRSDPRLDAIPDAELDELLEVRASLGSCAAFVDRARGRAMTARPVTRGDCGDHRTTNGQPRDWRRQFRGWPPRAGGDPPRVDLVLAPTPLHPAPRLSRELGVPVLFKRDDLAGVGLGGNKLRGLEFLIADALAQGCDSLVTGAGPQSNWTMLAALACLRYGLEAHIVCYGSGGGEPQGNMRLHRWLGVDVRFTGEAERSSVDAGIAAVTGELRAAGRHPYPVPRGGATPLGALGYVRASLELAGQLAGYGRAAGRIVAGHRVLRDPGRPGGRGGRDRRSLPGRGGDGEPPGRGSRGPGPGTGRRGGRARRDRRRPWMHCLAPDVRAGWIGPGYGVPSAAGQAAARLVAETEGVFLDPVFGAKAMAALIAGCRAGRVHGPQVFLVSGGAPTLFAGLSARRAGARRSRKARPDDRSASARGIPRHRGPDHQRARARARRGRLRAGDRRRAAAAPRPDPGRPRPPRRAGRMRRAHPRRGGAGGRGAAQAARLTGRRVPLRRGLRRRVQQPGTRTGAGTRPGRRAPAPRPDPPRGGPDRVPARPAGPAAQPARRRGRVRPRGRGPGHLPGRHAVGGHHLPPARAAVHVRALPGRLRRAGRTPPGPDRGRLRPRGRLARRCGRGGRYPAAAGPGPAGPGTGLRRGRPAHPRRDVVGRSCWPTRSWRRRRP